MKKFLLKQLKAVVSGMRPGADSKHPQPHVPSSIPYLSGTDEPKIFFAELDKSLLELNKQIGIYRQAEIITYRLLNKFQKLKDQGIECKEFLLPPNKNYLPALEKFDKLLDGTTNFNAVNRFKLKRFFKRRLAFTHDILILNVMKKHNIAVPTLF